MTMKSTTPSPYNKEKRASKESGGVFTLFRCVVGLMVLCVILFVGAILHYHDRLGQGSGYDFEHESMLDMMTSKIIKEEKFLSDYLLQGQGQGEAEKVRPVVRHSPINIDLDLVTPLVGGDKIKTDIVTSAASSDRGIGNGKSISTGLVSKPHSGSGVPPIEKHKLTCDGEFAGNKQEQLLEFWRETTTEDVEYVTPFTDSSMTKYVTFEPDVGGWNNIRMQMELVLVFAASTGRTLVLPPDQPMYLLNKGKGHEKEHSFADFFPFDYIRKRVPVISMKEFMEKEAQKGHLLWNANGGEKEGESYYPPTSLIQIPDGETVVVSSSDRKKPNPSEVSKKTRLLMWDYLRNSTSCPPWKGMKDFLVIPPRPGMNTSDPDQVSRVDLQDYQHRRDIFAGDKRYGMDRKPQYYNNHWHSQKVIHFISKPAWGYRLLEHFYTYIHFEDQYMDRYYKRFVRDYVHYVDMIFCKAGIIMHKLQEEAEKMGLTGFSTFHVRRGEFQYKNVKIPAEEMLENVGEFIPAGQLVYIATDEKDKNFFNAFRKRWPDIKFMDDYMDVAGLRTINPNFLGMIDQVVCVMGEQFIGTWFSTFSGYITRIRGYMGYPDNTTWYADYDHRDRFQQYEFPRFPFYMRENSISWFGIDEDHKDYWKNYFVKHPMVEDKHPWKKKNKPQKGKGADNKDNKGNNKGGKNKNKKNGGVDKGKGN